MGADSYFEPITVTMVTPTCRLCGWRGDTMIETPGLTGGISPSLSAFYAHFHASCVVQAANGEYEDFSDVGYAGPLQTAALVVLAFRRRLGPCARGCDARIPWCEHHQPGPDAWGVMWPESRWSREVPDWAKVR